MRLALSAERRENYSMLMKGKFPCLDCREEVCDTPTEVCPDCKKLRLAEVEKRLDKLSPAEW